MSVFETDITFGNYRLRVTYSDVGMSGDIAKELVDVSELFIASVPLVKFRFEQKENNLDYEYRIWLDDGRQWRQLISFFDNNPDTDPKMTFDVSQPWKLSEFVSHRDLRNLMIHVRNNINASLVPSTLSVDEIIIQGYKRAGLIPIEFDIGGDVQWNARAAHGRTVLNRLINGLAKFGLIENFLSHFVLDLTDGTSTYTVASADNILNIIGDGSYIPFSNDPEEVDTDGETPVRPITFHRWNQLSAKNATGTPSLYYLSRSGENLVLQVWPIPDEDGKIRFRTQRLPGSNSTGSNNPDLERYWDSWMVNALAYEFMTDAKLPLDERMAVKADAEAELAWLKSFESSQEGPDIVLMNSTPWSSWNNI